jgi:uncharacterized protein (DUF4415 family)
MATSPKKVRVNIYFDEDVVAYFKARAAFDDRPYGPLMNKILREYVAKQQTGSIRYGFAKPSK